MASTRINVLVYSGIGVSKNSVQHTIQALKQLLQPHYAVLPLQTDTLLNEPWPSTCAAIVFPGGGDVGYCNALNGAGNRKIKSFLSNGGTYLGFCAGGYYGSSRCEWEVGSTDMEVVGDRELCLFPGICRGTVFSGFQYGTEHGTTAAKLTVHRDAFKTPASLPDTFRSYFNGGGVFVDAIKAASKGVEVLASYDGPINVSGGDGQAAVVYCKYGDGAALLTGPHPEFTADRLSKHAKGMNPAVVDALGEDETPRRDFLRACLQKIGLAVNEDDSQPPSLTRINLLSTERDVLEQVRQSWTKNSKDGRIIDEADTFDFTTADAAPAEDQTTEDIKQIIIHTSPSAKLQTPLFNTKAYFSALASCRHSKPIPFGSTVLYGDVVTSTSTLLEKNPLFSGPLPQGTTFLAARQLSGRGRGANIWLSPPGSLLFSTVFSHTLLLNRTAPLVFVQYLAGIAVVEALRTYSPAGDYDRFSSCVRLKWPNDVYALHPAHIHPASSAANGSGDAQHAFVKIGGILVNTSYTEGTFRIVLGIGLNVANAAPTTSLNALIAAWNAAHNTNLPPFSSETLLARILSVFGSLYETFKVTGFAGEIERLYLSRWLHTGQSVTLETEGGVRARILGVTTDWGLLLAQSDTGERFALQTDSNSFDFFRGLVKRKL